MRTVALVSVLAWVLVGPALAEPGNKTSTNDDLKAMIRTTAFPADLVIKAGVVRPGQIKLIRTVTPRPKRPVPSTSTRLLRLQKRNLLGQSQRPLTRIHVLDGKGHLTGQMRL